MLADCISNADVFIVELAVNCGLDIQDFISYQVIPIRLEHLSVPLLHIAVTIHPIKHICKCSLFRVFYVNMDLPNKLLVVIETCFAYFHEFLFNTSEDVDLLLVKDDIVQKFVGEILIAYQLISPFLEQGQRVLNLECLIGNRFQLQKDLVIVQFPIKLRDEPCIGVLLFDMTTRPLI